MSGNPEMPGQRNKAGRTVGITAPAGPVRGLFRTPSVARSASVRGPHGPRTRCPTERFCTSEA